MQDLSKYEVTFSRSSLFGTWSWEVTTPGGGTLQPIFGGLFMDKENAEKDALKRIENHAAQETVDGESLRQRVEQPAVDGAVAVA